MGTLTRMGEADWWLCGACSSLNNLAARKCYSCGQGKPREAVRASEYLGYRPVVSWDGKVRLEQLTAEEREAEGGAQQAKRAELQVPALREPVPRDTLAVAPRPPNPARITYRLEVPPPVPPGALPMRGPGPMLAGTLPTAPGPVGVPGPVVPGPGAPGLGAPGLGAPGPGGVSASPLKAVGPGPAVAARPPGDPWPHWRELLAGPTPHAERLRDTVSGNATPRARSEPGSPEGGMTLRSAIRRARTGDAREFIPWPAADRRVEEAEGAGEAAAAWPSEDRAPE